MVIDQENDQIISEIIIQYLRRVNLPILKHIKDYFLSIFAGALFV